MTQALRGVAIGVGLCFAIGGVPSAAGALPGDLDLQTYVQIGGQEPAGRLQCFPGPGSHRRTDEPHPPERQRSLRSAAEPERAGEPDAAERRGALRYRSTLLDGEYVTGAAGVSRPDRRARRERVRLGFGRRRRGWRTGTRARGCSGGSRPPGSASRQHSPGRLMSNSAVGSDRRRERTRPPVRRRLKEETDKAYTKVLCAPHHFRPGRPRR